MTAKADVKRRKSRKKERRNARATSGKPAEDKECPAQTGVSDHNGMLLVQTRERYRRDFQRAIRDCY